LNYLFLLDWNHGKLLNFRSALVESRFVSTSLNVRNRTSFSIDEDSWKGSTDSDRLFKQRVLDLIADIGLWLDVFLYREALLFLMSDVSMGRQDIEICSHGRLLGTHSLCLLDAQTAWHLSTMESASESYKHHLLQLLSHTNLQQLHWINLGHGTIKFRTLKK
jgi:hypothetical protein